MEYNDQPPFLSKGSKVEVWSEEEGFTNALFSAEILRPPTRPPYSPTGRKRKKTTAVVKYDRMVSAEDGEPLVETVETRFLRPIPPPDIPDRPFELNEVVDAFHRDIWWTGFVVKVVNDRYTVAFKWPLDLLEFGRADMRPHWDWVGSKWVRPEKEDTKALIYTPGTEVEVNRHDEVPCRAWLPATVVGQVGYTSFLVRYKSSHSDGEEGLQQETVNCDQIRPRPPEMEGKNFYLLERVDVFLGSCWVVGLITKLLEGKRYIVTLRHKKEMEFSNSELRPHLEWIDGQWVTNSKGVTFTSDSQEQAECALHENSCSTVDNTGKERPYLGDKEDHQKELSTCVEKSPYLGSLNMGKENPIITDDKPVEIIPSGDDMKTKQQEAGETENQVVKSARKRGRPRKSHESSGSLLDNTKKGRHCLSDKQDNRKELSPQHVEKLPSFRSLNMEKEAYISNRDKLVEVIPNGDDKKTKEQEAGETESQAIKSAKKRGRQRKSCESSGSLLDNNGQKGDAETSSEIKGNGEHPEHPKLPVAELQTARADCATEKSELPVTTEVILTDTLEEGTTLVFPKPMKISSDDQASLMHIVETHAPTNVSESGNIGRTNVQNFPFVKSCQIWEIIESMEVFKKLPQNPNFQPLMKCKELKREGAAIAHMMNFVYVVEKISKLQENDSRQDLESIMEELAELEEMGFDVKVIRGRVTELVQVKVELEKLMHKSNGVETQIEKCSIEKTKIDGEVADIDKELKRLGEKRAKLMSERMDKDSEEFKLISEANDINIGISTGRERFRSLVVTPFGA